MASPARSDNNRDYQTWGHSMIVSPYGEVLSELGDDEDMIIHEIDIQTSDQMRAEIPLFNQQRTDIYRL
jgi:omega-amidase